MQSQLNNSMTVYYLYKKTHKTTKLQYLGYTQHNPHAYRGSGIRWLHHIKKYGYNVETNILFETTDKQKIKEMGIYYSNLWKVVESREWANLKPEGGEGGGVPGMNKGKARPQEHKDAMKAGWARAKANGHQPWNKGVVGLKGPCKPIVLVSPDGTEYRYDSMKQGCKEHNLIYTKMSSVKNGHLAHYKGWTIKPLNMVQSIPEK
jgi:hypothetical protein